MISRVLTMPVSSSLKNTKIGPSSGNIQRVLIACFGDLESLYDDGRMLPSGLLQNVDDKLLVLGVHQWTTCSMDSMFPFLKIFYI